MAQPSSKVKVAMMIDIETLDTARTAVVIQVAAVTFEYDLHGYYKELNSFNIPLRVGPQVDGGRTISASTIDWWLGEDKYKVFSQIICDGYDRPGDDCLLELKGELSFSNCDEYWFQGPTFDAIILEDLLGEGVVPWKYHQVRDQRTVDNLAWDQATIKSMKSEINHDALADVKNQVSRLLFCINEGKPAAPRAILTPFSDMENPPPNIINPPPSMTNSPISPAAPGPNNPFYGTGL